MRRPAPRLPGLGPAMAMAAALLLGSTGCAALMPTGAVLDSLGGAEVDVIVDKVASRYPSLGRLLSIESFVISLDTVIVGRPYGTEDEQHLVTTVASYMLGEAVGNQWLARVEGERAIFGEGNAVLAVYRAPEGERFLIDLMGSFALFLPLAGGARRGDGVEALSFDLRASNQPVLIRNGQGSIEIYAQILPRSAIYTSSGPVFKRWASALFHLGLEPEVAASDARPAEEALPPDAADVVRAKRIAAFLQHSRPFAGPLVRFELSLHRTKEGATSLTMGRPNRVDLVLPSDVIAGDQRLEKAFEQLARSYPGHLRRQDAYVLVRVGHFFFHPDATGPERKRISMQECARLKEFRIPPGR